MDYIKINKQDLNLFILKKEHGFYFFQKFMNKINKAILLWYNNIYKLDYINIINMIEVKSKVRQWGRSLGIVLPKEEIKIEGIEKDDLVTVLISKKKNPLKETFGTLRIRKSTDEILKESDRDAWDE